MPPNSKDFIKKREKINTKEGGLGQNPQRKKNKSESKKLPKNKLWKFVVG